MDPNDSSDFFSAVQQATFDGGPAGVGALTAREVSEVLWLQTQFSWQPRARESDDFGEEADEEGGHEGFGSEQDADLDYPEPEDAPPPADDDGPGETAAALGVPQEGPSGGWKPSQLDLDGVALSTLANPRKQRRAVATLETQRPNRRQLELDLPQTIRASCAHGEPVLALRPSRAAATHVVFLVDTNPSMAPWERQREQLEALLKQTSLASYRTLELDLSARARPALEPRAWLRGGERTLVLLWSDGLSQGFPWLAACFAGLPERATLAWAHPWPRRAWRRTRERDLRAYTRRSTHAVPILVVSPTAQGWTAVGRLLHGRSVQGFHRLALPLDPDRYRRRAPLPTNDTQWHQHLLRLERHLPEDTRTLLGLMAAFAAEYFDLQAVRALAKHGRLQTNVSFLLSEALTAGVLQAVRTTPEEEVGRSDAEGARWQYSFRDAHARHLATLFIDVPTLQAVVDKHRAESEGGRIESVVLATLEEAEDGLGSGRDSGAEVSGGDGAGAAPSELGSESVKSDDDASELSDGSRSDDSRSDDSRSDDSRSDDSRSDDSRSDEWFSEDGSRRAWTVLEWPEAVRTVYTPTVPDPSAPIRPEDSAWLEWLERAIETLPLKVRSRRKAKQKRVDLRKGNLVVAQIRVHEGHLKCKLRSRMRVGELSYTELLAGEVHARNKDGWLLAVDESRIETWGDLRDFGVTLLREWREEEAHRVWINQLHETADGHARHEARLALEHLKLAGLARVARGIERRVAARDPFSRCLFDTDGGIRSLSPVPRAMRVAQAFKYLSLSASRGFAPAAMGRALVGLVLLDIRLANHEASKLFRAVELPETDTLLAWSEEPGAAESGLVCGLRARLFASGLLPSTAEETLVQVKRAAEAGGSEHAMWFWANAVLDRAEEAETWGGEDEERAEQWLDMLATEDMELTPHKVNWGQYSLPFALRSIEQLGVRGESQRAAGWRLLKRLATLSDNEGEPFGDSMVDEASVVWLLRAIFHRDGALSTVQLSTAKQALEDLRASFGAMDPDLARHHMNLPYDKQFTVDTEVFSALERLDSNRLVKLMMAPSAGPYFDWPTPPVWTRHIEGIPPIRISVNAMQAVRDALFHPPPEANPLGPAVSALLAQPTRSHASRVIELAESASANAQDNVFALILNGLTSDQLHDLPELRASLVSWYRSPVPHPDLEPAGRERHRALEGQAAWDRLIAIIEAGIDHALDDLPRLVGALDVTEAEQRSRWALGLAQILSNYSARMTTIQAFIGDVDISRLRDAPAPSPVDLGAQVHTGRSGAVVLFGAAGVGCIIPLYTAGTATFFRIAAGDDDIVPHPSHLRATGELLADAPTAGHLWQWHLYDAIRSCGLEPNEGLRTFRYPERHLNRRTGLPRRPAGVESRPRRAPSADRSKKALTTAPLRRYAPAARRSFIAAVTSQAALVGITAEGTATARVQGDVLLIGGHAIPARLSAARKELAARVAREGFHAAMEAVAYTWFNRFAAIRYMEVHGFLGHGHRVLSDAVGGSGRPEILDHAVDVELPGLNRSQMVDLKLAGDRDDELYRMLLLAQCADLHHAMPFLFDPIGSATELLMPANLLHTDSLTRQMVAALPDPLWKDIEVVGWLYQFYISEKKQRVMGRTVAHEDIPAATQLFTPKWIVKYLVQNSLGAQWMATYPQSPLAEEMEYYIRPAPHAAAAVEGSHLLEAGVVGTGKTSIFTQLARRLGESFGGLVKPPPTELDPEALTLVDPACGSGHILVVAYDLFKAIYLERGYRLRDVPQLILSKNLYGFDIDPRAAQLTGFALMMKGRADDRRLFQRKLSLNVLAFEDSSGLDVERLSRDVHLPGWGLAKPDLFAMKRLFARATTMGSLLRVPDTLVGKLYDGIDGLANSATQDMFIQHDLSLLRKLVRQAKLLRRGYDAVVMNPPYMGTKGMCLDLKNFVSAEYPLGRSDLYACFMERGRELMTAQGACAMITMQGWMFQSGMEGLRRDLLSRDWLSSLLYLGARAFSTISGEVVQTAAFVFQKSGDPSRPGTYVRLDHGGEEQKRQRFLGGEHRFTGRRQEDFLSIPGAPVAFWLTENMIRSFGTLPPLGELLQLKAGMSTGNNLIFQRHWHEVDRSTISMFYPDSPNTWVPCNSGGNYRKWYGNNSVVVKWKDDGKQMRSYRNAKGKIASAIRNESFYFRPGITWTKLSKDRFAARWMEDGYAFDDTGRSGFLASSRHRRGSVLAVMLSAYSQEILSAIAPTLSFTSGELARLPVPGADDAQLETLAKSAVAEAKRDWDSWERSWDFVGPEVVRRPGKKLEDACAAWARVAGNRTKALDAAQRAIDKRVWTLVGEPDHPVTGGLAQVTLDANPVYRYGSKLSQAKQWARFRRDTLEELVSYAIGCMMGRYSLDQPGLVYAHAANKGFDPSKYTTFPADEDGILPLTDTKWFDDDACSRVVEFLSVVWPKAHLESNLAFLAQNLGPKKNESSRDTLRRWLCTSFFRDHHKKRYNNRPIYWQFTSGRRKAFQCLVYLHRYHEGTLARMRSEYVLPLQGKLRARIETLDGDIPVAASSAAEKRLRKERDTLENQLAELQAFGEKLRHYADRRITLDLDDGVKVNYGKFGSLLDQARQIHGKAPVGP